MTVVADFWIATRMPTLPASAESDRMVMSRHPHWQGENNTVREPKRKAARRLAQPAKTVASDRENFPCHQRTKHRVRLLAGRIAIFTKDGYAYSVTVQNRERSCASRTIHNPRSPLE